MVSEASSSVLHCSRLTTRSGSFASRGEFTERSHSAAHESTFKQAGSVSHLQPVELAFLPFSTAVLHFGSAGDNMRALANASSGCACGQSGGTGRGICTRRETVQAVPSPSEAHMAALNSLCLGRRARALHYFLACPLYVAVN